MRGFHDSLWFRVMRNPKRQCAVLVASRKHSFHVRMPRHTSHVTGLAEHTANLFAQVSNVEQLHGLGNSNVIAITETYSINTDPVVGRSEQQSTCVVPRNLTNVTLVSMAGQPSPNHPIRKEIKQEQFHSAVPAHCQHFRRR
jgi:predicted secreted Zn-dependent protease